MYLEIGAWIRASLPFMGTSGEAGPSGTLRNFGNCKGILGVPGTWVAVKELLANVKLTQYGRTVHRASF